MNKEIYILGVGHNTEVYIDLAESCGYRVAGLYHYNDERTGESVLGKTILDSTIHLLAQKDLKRMNFAISMGDNFIRCELANQIESLNGNIPNLFHPSAVISKYATIQSGVIVNANSVVQAHARIGKNSVISNNVSVSHHSTIGMSCYCAAGSKIGAYVTIEDHVMVGQGAVLISEKAKRIGENSIIGAGAIVTKSFDRNSILLGSPARNIADD